jgi:hypothetical protein
MSQGLIVPSGVIAWLVSWMCMWAGERLTRSQVTASKLNNGVLTVETTGQDYVRTHLSDRARLLIRPCSPCSLATWPRLASVPSSPLVRP